MFMKEEDYVDRTLEGVDELWSGLKALAACKDYRDVCMMAGARIIQSLKTGSSDTVRAAINTFESSPLGPLPPYKILPHNRAKNWDDVKAAIARLPSYEGAAPSSAMLERCLPSLRGRVSMEVESKRSANSSQPRVGSKSSKAQSERTFKKIRPG